VVFSTLDDTKRMLVTNLELLMRERTTCPCASATLVAFELGEMETERKKLTSVDVIAYSEIKCHKQGYTSKVTMNAIWSIGLFASHVN
jgi:GTP cyclohydrolase FolE2